MAGNGRIVSAEYSVGVCISNFSNSAPNIIRLMDVVNERIVPVAIDPTQPKRFSNRDAFFYDKTTMHPGEIAVFYWEAEENLEKKDSDYITIRLEPELIPIEIIPVAGAHSPDDLVEKLRVGVNATPMAETRHVLFSFASNKFVHTGILIPKNALTRMSDGKVKVVEALTVAKIYQIAASKVANVSMPKAPYGTSLPSSILLCKVFDLGTEDDVVCLRSPIELVKSVILSKASWPRYSKLIGGTHAEHDAFKSFLAAIGEPTIVKDIMTAASVSETVAMKFLDEFREQAGNLLHANELDKETIDSIIQSNENLRTECVESGKKLWLEKNQELIAEAEKQASEKKAELDALEAKKTAAEKETQTISEKLKKINNEYREKQASIKNVPALLKKYLTDGSSEIYRMMTERALCGFGGGGTIRPSEELTCESVPGGTYTEALNCLAERLVDIGANDIDSAIEYAALLLACYYNKETCVITGHSASEVIRSLSAVVCNRSQDILECSSNWDPTLWEVALNGEGEILEIRDDSLEWFHRMTFDLIAHKKRCFLAYPHENISLTDTEYNQFITMDMNALIPHMKWTTDLPKTAVAEDGSLAYVKHEGGKGRGEYASAYTRMEALFPLADSFSVTPLHFRAFGDTIVNTTPHEIKEDTIVNTTPHEVKKVSEEEAKELMDEDTDAPTPLEIETGVVKDLPDPRTWNDKRMSSGFRTPPKKFVNTQPSAKALGVRVLTDRDCMK